MDSPVYRCCFLVLFYVVSVSAMIEEPQCTCSRFHYEEQLLEKMIRTEMKFQALQEQLDAKLEGFTKTMTDIAAKTSENLEKFNSTNQNFINTNNQRIDSTLSGMKRIKSLTEASWLKRNVTFKAKKVADLTPQTGQVYVFTEVLLNTGSGYDKTTGKFTAPIDGTYLFTCHLCQHSTKYLHYGVMLDGTEILRGYFKTGENICTSFDVITEMTVAQSVWIQAFHSDHLYEDIWRWNVFSGVLIR